MKFWDSSAAVSLLAGQHGDSGVESVIEEDAGLVLWWGTRVELVSAACRLRREKQIGDKTLSKLLEKINEITSDADEIEPSEEVRNTAMRILRVHNLRAADSLQLAAALIWTQHDPSKAGFVCLDKRLREAAEREGFHTLPE